MIETVIYFRRGVLSIYALACVALTFAFVWLGFGPQHEMPVGIALALISFYGLLSALCLRVLIFPKLIETTATGLTLYHPFALKSRFIHWEELAVIDLALKHSMLMLGVRENAISHWIQVPVIGLRPYPMIAARQLHNERTAYFTAKNAPSAEEEALGTPLALEQPEARFEAPEDFFLSPFVMGVIALNVAFTIYALIAGLSWMHAASLDLVASGGGYPPLVVRGEPWRLLTYALLHNGLFVLFFESLALIILGRGERLYDDISLALIYLGGMTGGFLLTAHLHPYGVQAGGAAPLLAVLGASFVRKFSHSGARRRSATALFAAFGLVGLSLLCSLGTLDSALPIGGALVGLMLGYLGERARAQTKFMATAGGVAVFAAAILFVLPKPLDALGAVERSRQSFEVIRAYASNPLKVGASREECDNLDKEITAKQVKPTQDALDELSPLRAITEEPTRTQVQKLITMGQDLSLGAKIKVAVNTRRRREFTLDEDLRNGRLMPEQGFAQVLEQWLPELKESEPPFLAALSKAAAAKMQADDAQTAKLYLRRAQQLAVAALRRDLKADVARATTMLESNDSGDPLLENAQAFIVKDFVAHAEVHRARLARLTALGQAPDTEADALLQMYADARRTFNVVAVDYSIRRRFKRLSHDYDERAADAQQSLGRMQKDILPYLENFKLDDARAPASAGVGATDTLALERRRLLQKYGEAILTGKPKNVRAAENDWRALDNGNLAMRPLLDAKQIIQTVANLRDGA